MISAMRSSDLVIPVVIGAAVAAYTRRQALAERSLRGASATGAGNRSPTKDSTRKLVRENRFLRRGILLYLLLMGAMGIALSFRKSLVLGLVLAGLLAAWIYFELKHRRWGVITFPLSPRGSGRAWEIHGWLAALHAAKDLRRHLETGEGPNLNATLLAEGFAGFDDQLVDVVGAPDGTIWAVRARPRLPLVPDDRWIGIA